MIAIQSIAEGHSPSAGMATRAVMAGVKATERRAARGTENADHASVKQQRHNPRQNSLHDCLQRHIEERRLSRFVRATLAYTGR